jgi:hypothetical protein
MQGTNNTRERKTLSREEKPTENTNQGTENLQPFSWAHSAPTKETKALCSWERYTLLKQQKAPWIAKPLSRD